MSEDGWMFHKDYVQTVVINSDNDYLVLSLDIGGFHGDVSSTNGDRHKQQVAELSFEFETQCSQYCEFALLKVCASLCTVIRFTVELTTDTGWPATWKTWKSPGIPHWSG